MSEGKIPRIFVVDDEKVIAETLAIILQKSGFSARFFTNPLECLAACLSDVPDLLISDVNMPEISGIDLGIRMKERCPGCKVLLFSGAANQADLLLAAREEGHEFHLLPKPVHPHDLLREIRGQDPMWIGRPGLVQ